MPATAHANTAAPPDTADGLVLDKLCCSLNVRRPAVPAVLVACGSFNPPTFMHLRMFEVAMASLQQAGYDVWGGYMSPVADAYRKPGLAEAGHRIRMCQLTAASKPHVMVDPWEALQPEYTFTLEVLRKIRRQLTQALLAPAGSPNGASDDGYDATSSVGDGSPTAVLEHAGSAAASSGSNGGLGTSGAREPGHAAGRAAASLGADGAVDGFERHSSARRAGGGEAQGSRDTLLVRGGELEPSVRPKVLLLCGADVLASMAIPGVWENLPGIFREFGVVCVTRDGTDMRELLEGPDSALRQYADCVHVVEDSVGSFVSSSLVRRKLAQGERVEGLLEAPVEAYIREQGLYGCR